MTKNISIIISFLILPIISFSQSWQSNIVHYGNNNKLVYQSDPEGNKIPDFSYAGYKGGGVSIPSSISVVKTLSPITGDNTAQIQKAISEVGFMPMDSNGFRGVIFLEPGIYRINSTIKLNYSGIILRGSGQTEDSVNSTILYGVGNTPNQRTILIAGGGSSTKWKDQVSGTKTNIIDDSIFVGDRSFSVQDASHYSVGDNIIIYHPCTQSWLEAIDYGGTHSNEPGAEPGVDVPWAIGSQPIIFNRYITNIEGNKITIDAPVFNTLKKNLAQSYIYKYSRSGIKTNIGIENLRVDIETKGGTDEAHAWNAIDLFQIEDSWVKDCTMIHFGQSGIRTNTATRITVEDCSALDPVSQITGERRYNFQVYTASQQILFYQCNATNGRHHYVSNGTTWTSGCVFLDCTSSGAYASSEGHRRWSMGLLYDNLTELDGPRPGINPRLLGLYNRGYYGTSHGWAAANSVAWNCNENNGDLIIQKPPTAQNYAIGCFGKNVTGISPPASFDDPEGYIEGTNKDSLNPRSLYLAQLHDRIGSTVNVNDKSQNSIPKRFKLFQNYPNPFNPETIIRYTLNKSSEVKMEVFNVLGKKVKTLVNKYQAEGAYSVTFNPTNFASGVYYYRLITRDNSSVKKMIFLR